jgi:hypothetical protein
MLKKYGVVLLLIIAVSGFSMSSVSAAHFNENYNLTVGGHCNISLPYDDYYRPIGDAKDYVYVKYQSLEERMRSCTLEFIGKKVTPNGKPAQFEIPLWKVRNSNDTRLLSFEVKK